MRYQSGNLNLTAVKAFLVKYFQEIIVQELNSDWIANGRLVGKLGHKISPLNLSEVTEFENGGDLHGTKEIIHKDLLAGGLLLIYRCIRIPSGGYEHDFLTTLMTRAKVVFPKSPYLNLIISRNNYQSWDQDPGLRIIVAALDTFLVKFPNHPQSKLRMGTIPSRWRDCSALKSIYEIIERYTLDKLIVLLSW